jgi:hypothetical protein
MHYIATFSDNIVANLALRRTGGFMKLSLLMIVPTLLLTGCFPMKPDCFPIKQPDAAMSQSRACPADTPGIASVMVANDRDVSVDPESVHSKRAGNFTAMSWVLIPTTDPYVFPSSPRAVHFFFDVQKQNPAAIEFGCSVSDQGKSLTCYYWSQFGSTYYYDISVQRADGTPLTKDPTIVND